MQPALLCASVSISCLLLTAPLHAGEKHVERGVRPHTPDRPLSHPLPSGMGQAAVVRRPIQVVRPPQPVVVLPLRERETIRRNPASPPVFGGFEREKPHVVQPVAIVERPVRPLSFNSTDPRAVITRLPSGRIAMSPPAGLPLLTPWQVAESNRRLHPYAQPSFQIIGAPLHHGAGSAVYLTYGVKPGRRVNPEPQVVFLDAAGRAPQGSARIHPMK